MTGRFHFFIVVLLLASHATFAQKRLHVTIKITCNGGEITLPAACGNSSQSIRVETLRFYLSGISLYNGERLVWTEKSSYHLIDAAEQNSLKWEMNIPQNLDYDHVKFNLGIDSATNVSGAMTGDLDPTKGMYWTWQSGYINFKLEGKSPQGVSPRQEVAFHLGGYSAPYPSWQTIELMTQNKNQITIGFDVAKFLDGIDLQTAAHIMSPGKSAAELSVKAAKAFAIE